MSTCSTCRFWNLHDGDVPPAEELAPRGQDYEIVLPGYECRYCDVAQQFEYPERNGASTMDGSQYWSALVTGPDFGCVRWEGK